MQMDFRSQYLKSYFRAETPEGLYFFDNLLSFVIHVKNFNRKIFYFFLKQKIKSIQKFLRNDKHVPLIVLLNPAYLKRGLIVMQKRFKRNIIKLWLMQFFSEE